MHYQNIVEKTKLFLSSSNIHYFVKETLLHMYKLNWFEIQLIAHSYGYGRSAKVPKGRRNKLVSHCSSSLDTYTHKIHTHKKKKKLKTFNQKQDDPQIVKVEKIEA